MHELAIAEAVVERVLNRTDGRPVSRVRLQVGQLSGVVADALSFCFELATVGTSLEGALLDIDEIEGAAHCRTCDQDFAVPDLLLLCPCGSANVEVVAGSELAVTSVEVG